MTSPPVERRAYQKVAVTVRPSAIDGHGVFAAEAVRAHKKIGEIRSVESKGNEFIALAMLSLVHLNPAAGLSLGMGGPPVVRIKPHG